MEKKVPMISSIFMSSYLNRELALTPVMAPDIKQSNSLLHTSSSCSSSNTVSLSSPSSSSSSPATYHISPLSSSSAVSRTALDLDVYNSTPSIRFAHSCHQGYRSSMEDSYVTRPILCEKNHPNTKLFAVFDGHNGSKTSNSLATVLPEEIAKLTIPHAPDQLKQCFMNLDQHHFPCHESGSTAVVAIIDETRNNSSNLSSTSSCSSTTTTTTATSSSAAYNNALTWTVTIANVGDSRAILLRGTSCFFELTTDHKPSYVKEKKRIEEAGGKVINDRVLGDLAISRAFGDSMFKVNVNKSPIVRKTKTSSSPLANLMMTAEPDITRITAEEGDILLLFCDGIVETLENADIAQYVAHLRMKEKIKFLTAKCTTNDTITTAPQRQQSSPPTSSPSQPREDIQYYCDQIVQYALQSKSHDNLSVLAIMFERNVKDDTKSNTDNNDTKNMKNKPLTTSSEADITLLSSAQESQMKPISASNEAEKTLLSYAKESQFNDNDQAKNIKTLSLKDVKNSFKYQSTSSASYTMLKNTIPQTLTKIPVTHIQKSWSRPPIRCIKVHETSSIPLHMVHKHTSRDR
jgi:serine/threonine protein phosphatase PrpC